jgi:flagellar protein FliL
MAEEKESEDVVEEKKKGGMLKIILMVVAALLISGISIVVTMMLTGGDEAPSENQEAAVEDELKPMDQVVTPEQGEAIYFPFKQPFVVNYDAGGRQRYLQLEISVVARDQASIDTVNDHLPLIRNNLLELLQRQQIDDLRTNDGKVKLTEELTTVIQNVVMEELGRPGVQRVLYLKFVMQ